MLITAHRAGEPRNLLVLRLFVYGQLLGHHHRCHVVADPVLQERLFQRVTDNFDSSRIVGPAMQVCT
ncbi:hypothetical protein ACFQVD_09410 [Streptosporangium amethystogenes subsp. fukuiense]|uniref:Secreted protein n=1 Tax=Streptosporangium amethystogenes subsp. fukuiense TaxID=698418 RepID=A0ABW2SVL5_9ACTN